MTQAYVPDTPDTPAGSDAVLSGNGALLILHGVLTISAYTNPGGEVLDLVADRPNAVAQVYMILFGGPSGRDFSWDATTKKVTAYTTAATEVANGTNIGALPYVAICKPKA